MLQTVDVGTELGTGGTDGIQGVFHLGDLRVEGSGGQGGGRHIGGGKIGFRGINGCVDGLNIAAGIHIQLLGGGTTDLEGHCCGAELARIADQSLTTKLGVVADVLQLGRQLLHFGAHGQTVFRARGAVGALGGQVFHALNDVGHLVHGTFGGLHHGDGVLGVAHADLLAVGLGLQTGSHLQTGGVIGGGVDAKTGTQALHGGAQHLVGVVQLVLSGQRSEVGMNGQTHDLFLEEGCYRSG